MKKLHLLLILMALLYVVPICLYGQETNYGNGLPATDAVGRKLPLSETVSSSKEGKFVGLFYWTWHTNFADNEVADVTKILAQKPEAINDYNDPIWPKKAPSYYWGEPLFGYYRDTDHWVLRKHAEMLADAGVDAIFFDCTNGSFTWKESYMELCKVFEQARQDGVKVPQIVFMLGFGPTPEARIAIRDIYNSLYKPGLYKDLWFNWKGKPLILAYPEMLTDLDVPVSEKAEDKEIFDFFTFRPAQPVYDKGPARPDHWGWLEIYPQHAFGKNAKGGAEQVTVGVSQNWSRERGLTAMNAPNTFGRSYTDAKGQIEHEGAVNYGYNFQEQWDRAIELDPEFIFITGWNEWIAGRFEEWQQQKNAFPDQYSQEKSRDVEPMKGGHGDNYYYQMVDNIRKFKGSPSASPKGTYKTMKIDGDFAEWQNVTSEFNTYKGNTIHRNSRGWGSLHYNNTTGRNDIVRTKVAHDKKYIYFYVETANEISPSTDTSWMRLLINTDRDHTTGWEGYDYIINRISPDKKAIIEKNKGDWNWTKSGKVDFIVKGNKMELSIPKSLLGIKDSLNFEFKWSDNMQEDGNIMDFYLNGDVAPLGRFNYLYIE